MDKKERKDYVKELNERFNISRINFVTELWVDKETGVEYLRLGNSELRPFIRSRRKAKYQQEV